MREGARTKRPNQRERVVDQPNTIYRELEIAADPGTVFTFFTDPQRLTRWIGRSASLLKEGSPRGTLPYDLRVTHGGS
jgi:uncharacterized protein YndB with AHSA1/START domain